MTSDESLSAGTPPAETKRPAGFLALTLGSIGVVYGDIGTSPLYALREALRHAAEDGLLPGEVLGVVSLLLWALILIVSLKYVLFLLHADNKGEGGVLSLFALAQSSLRRRTTFVFILGICGAALFFGDAMITPAISVLSAVEGLELAAPDLGSYVIPITVVILIVLFAIQRRGTSAIAAWFGPLTALWFVTIAIIGAAQIFRVPTVLLAINPLYAVSFLAGHGFVGLVILGAVFLAVTGAEALYADLGHFGRRPIQTAWFAVVFPALAINYLGQGALVLSDPAALRNPFLLLAPEWGRLPLVVLATAATVIASQAVITGTYSLARQAVQLGFLPRLDIRHTSETLTGQIYLPAVNWLLLAGVLLLVFIFETSSALAAAYGIAVTGTMVVTTALAFVFVRHGWRWPLPLAIAVCLPIALVEGAFLAANGLKLPDGGYLPMMIAAILLVIMWTWVRGTTLLMAKMKKTLVPLADLMRSLEEGESLKVPGTAVFLTSDPFATPPALLHNLKHNHVLHEQVVIVTVVTADEPTIADSARTKIDQLSERFYRVELRFGFMESPNVSRALGLCRKQGLRFDVMSTSFFLGRRKLVPDARVGMPTWQDRIFITLVHLAADPTDFYHLPRDRVVELGTQVTV